MNGFPILPWRHIITRLLIVVSPLLVLAVPAAVAQQRPSGQTVIAWHVTIAPGWFTSVAMSPFPSYEDLKLKD